ncbi:hypothetical protein F4824DRAFT_506114 [Ustulina deusta]|nr:hypothetical protein F4824DRAFT_506114 [Ustulina deusta]
MEEIAVVVSTRMWVSSWVLFKLGFLEDEDSMLPPDAEAWWGAANGNILVMFVVLTCMRLRKLGRGQSVVFCVSAEIRDKIQRVTARPSGAAIEVKDVLHWAISETFAETERSMPLWAAQGVRFLRQEELWKSVQTDGVTSMSNTSAEQFLDKEAQSIKARYGPRPEKSTSIASLLRTGTRRLGKIRERYSEFEQLNFDSSTSLCF